MSAQCWVIEIVLPVAYKAWAYKAWAYQGLGLSRLGLIKAWAYQGLGLSRLGLIKAWACQSLKAKERKLEKCFEFLSVGYALKLIRRNQFCKLLPDPRPAHRIGSGGLDELAQPI
jgi:hypothetical protein